MSACTPGIHEGMKYPDNKCVLLTIWKNPQCNNKRTNVVLLYDGSGGPTVAKLIPSIYTYTHKRRQTVCTFTITDNCPWIWIHRSAVNASISLNGMTLSHVDTWTVHVLICVVAMVTIACKEKRDLTIFVPTCCSCLLDTVEQRCGEPGCVEFPVVWNSFDSNKKR